MSTIAIVTSCDGNYAGYLGEWAASIAQQTRKPDHVVIVTHGSIVAERAGVLAAEALAGTCPVTHRHMTEALDFGAARNAAVHLAEAEWVCHLDADDMLMEHALADWQQLEAGADVVAFGYARSGNLSEGPRNPTRVYANLVGTKQVLEASAPCSGVSPFRKALWQQRPYRTDLRGAWDTALWIGFAYLNPQLRIVATPRPVFWYRQHADSIFNTRRVSQDWTRAHVEASLQTLRRDCRGVSILVPLDAEDKADRRRLWRHVEAYYRGRFPAWEIVPGFASGRGWRKSLAVADAVERSRGTVLVIADADCLISPDALAEAVDRVGTGKAPWAVPHRDVVRLNAAKTEEQLAALPGFVEVGASDLARPIYEGFPGGGLVVVRRVDYLASGGIPASFTGWGSEDQALAAILDCCVGPHWRGSAPLLHLWHEPQAKHARGLNHAKLQVIRQVAASGRDDLIRFLRTGLKPVDTMPHWKRRGIEARRGMAPAKEPHWILAAKRRADQVAAERRRDA